MDERDGVVTVLGRLANNLESVANFYPSPFARHERGNERH